MCIRHHYAQINTNKQKGHESSYKQLKYHKETRLSPETEYNVEQQDKKHRSLGKIVFKINLRNKQNRFVKCSV